MRSVAQKLSAPMTDQRRIMILRRLLLEETAGVWRIQVGNCQIKSSGTAITDG